VKTADNDLFTAGDYSQDLWLQLVITADHTWKLLVITAEIPKAL